MRFHAFLATIMALATGSAAFAADTSPPDNVTCIDAAICRIALCFPFRHTVFIAKVAEFHAQLAMGDKLAMLEDMGMDKSRKISCARLSAVIEGRRKIPFHPSCDRENVAIIDPSLTDEDECIAGDEGYKCHEQSLEALPKWQPETQEHQSEKRQVDHRTQFGHEAKPHCQTKQSSQFPFLMPHPEDPTTKRI